MRISRDVVVKAALGALIFGRDVEAQAAPASNEASALPTTTARTEQPTPEPSNSSSALELLNTQHRWTIPADIRFNKPAEFKYALGYNSDLKKFGDRLMLLLVQTSAKYPTPVTKENSWIVIQLLPCTNGVCSGGYVFNDEDKQQENAVTWIFEQNLDYEFPAANAKNFFLCFGAMEGGHFTCTIYSDFFAIVGALPAKPSSGSVSGGDGQGSTGGVAPVLGANDRSGVADETDSTAATPANGGQVPGDSQSSEPSPRPKVSGTLDLTASTPLVTYKDIPSSIRPTSRPTVAPSSTQITITTPLLGPTAEATLSPTNSNSTSPGRGGGLPIGAIVGIIMGVLVLLSILAALAIFFCLKRRRQRNGAQKHEQVMLTQAQGDNNSSDHFAEKDAVVTTLIHPNSNDTTFSHDSGVRQTLIPAGGINRSHSTRDAPAIYHDNDETRDIRLTPYTSRDDHIPSSTTPFIAGTVSSAPRRNPTNASQAPSAISALSRNTSTSTIASHQRSGSTEYSHSLPHNALHNINEEQSSSTNETPRYGDARHTPTFHTGVDGAVSVVQHGGVSSSPDTTTGVGSYLHTSEPGMSQEEMARLEDEERRIDEAIAAAERAKGLR